MTNSDSDEGFDWGEPGNRPLGLNERQVNFCRAILQGYNQTQAAKKAGYLGDEKTLRSQGSRTYHSAKVQALLRMVQESDDSEEDEGTSDELRQLLWKEARKGGNPSSRVRAMELLAKYSNPLRPDQPLDKVSDLDFIRMFEALYSGSLWSAMCVLLAQNFPADGFNTPETAALRAHRMPQSAWEGLVQSYPAVAEVLRQKGCGGHREADETKANGSRRPDTSAAPSG